MPLFPSRATSLSHHLSLSLSPFIRLPCLATWNILIPPLSPPQFHSTIMIVLLHLSNFDRLIPRPLFSRDGGGGGGNIQPRGKTEIPLSLSSTFALAVSTTVPVSRIRIAVLSGDGEKRCIADPAVSA